MVETKLSVIKFWQIGFWHKILAKSGFSKIDFLIKSGKIGFLHKVLAKSGFFLQDSLVDLSFKNIAILHIK